MRRHPQPDPVGPELREQVILRDIREWTIRSPLIIQERMKVTSKVGCVAVFLDPRTSGSCSGPLTLDHVKDQPMMGKRAPSDLTHLVTICFGHHVETGWATSHRPVLRWYLKSLYDSKR